MPGLSIPAVAWEVMLHSSQWLPRPFPPSLSIGSERAHAWHALSLTTKALMVIWAAQALLLGVQCNPLRPGPTADHRSDEAGLPGCGGTKRPLFLASCHALLMRNGSAMTGLSTLKKIPHSTHLHTLVQREQESKGRSGGLLLRPVPSCAAVRPQACDKYKYK